MMNVRKFTIVLQAKTGKAQVPYVAMTVLAKDEDEAIDRAKQVLISPTRWVVK